MKKFWWIIFIIVILTSLTYVLIPNPIIVNKTLVIHVKTSIVERYLHDENKWLQWFPVQKNSNLKFTYNNTEYKPGNESYSSKEVTIINSDESYNSIINVLPIGYDSSGIEWKFQTIPSKNPIKRVIQYQKAKRVWNDINELLIKFKTAVQSNKNVYNFDINYTTLTDTALVSITKQTSVYPDTKTIYNLVDKLKLYIKSEHAAEHNYPMLNITTLKDSIYKLMVGIPTNIPLKGNNEIFPKRMIMIKNKTLVTDVKGDANEIRKAFTAIKYFMQDNQFKSPVIPFQQLVTDRRQQADSTKWVTKIFAPFD